MKMDRKERRLKRRFIKTAIKSDRLLNRMIYLLNLSGWGYDGWNPVRSGCLPPNEENVEIWLTRTGDSDENQTLIKTGRLKSADMFELDEQVPDGCTPTLWRHIHKENLNETT